MAKHSLELKMKIVTEYLEGKSSLMTLSQKYNIGDSQISKWVNNYRNFGLNGLKGYLKALSMFRQSLIRLYAVKYIKTHTN